MILNEVFTSSQSTADAIEPLAGPERVQLLDCLRGIALFGVLFVNMTWFATGGTAVPTAQLASLPTAAVDRWVDVFMQVFVYAKANTLFTLLFGISFAMQMDRIRGRGEKPTALYTRRLIGLLAIGVVHFFGMWKGEILHVYAIAGFVLLATLRWTTPALVATGIFLVVLVHPLLSHLPDVLQWLGLAGYRRLAVDAGTALLASNERLSVFTSGSYTAVLRAQWSLMLASGYLGLGLAIWVAYAVGRFMLGVAIARAGLLSHPERHIRLLWAVVWIGLPVGLICTTNRWLLQALHSQGWMQSPEHWPEHWRTLTDHLLQLLGTLMMAAAYVSLVAIGWMNRRVQRWLMVFPPIGRMALTNYLAQSLFNAVVFFGFGLGLMGRIGVSGCLALSIIFFAAQVVYSYLWLQRHPFGPVEWLWRWWTYRRRPVWWRRARTAGVQP